MAQPFEYTADELDELNDFASRPDLDGSDHEDHVDLVVVD